MRADHRVDLLSHDALPERVTQSLTSFRTGLKGLRTLSATVLGLEVAFPLEIWTRHISLLYHLHAPRESQFQ